MRINEIEDGTFAVICKLMMGVDVKEERVNKLASTTGLVLGIIFRFRSDDACIVNDDKQHFSPVNPPTQEV